MICTNGGKDGSRFEQIAKLAEDGVWTLDADDRTDFINERGASMLGCTPQELIGRASFDLLFPDRARSAELLAELRAGRAHIGETSLLRGDGTTVWLRYRMHPLYDDLGRYGGAVSMLTDITGMKEIDRGVRESEERLRMATEAAGMFTIEYDMRTHEIIFSENYSSVVGRPPPASLEEMIGSIHPEDRELLLAARARAERDGWDRVDYEYRSFVDPRRMRWFHAWNQLIRDANGSPVRVISITQDITERKRVEEELRRSNAELQQFAYISSHDLQEPLRMVTMFTELLGQQLGGSLDPQARTYMGYVSEGATRMRALVSDLLAYSRADSEPPELVEFDMEKAVGEVVSGLSGPIAEGNAKVIVHHLPRVTADELKIREVLQNLISNGIKFNRSERPTIEVFAQTLATEVVIAVRDNGIGIDPKHREKLFDMFARLHTREEYQGTGMGLPIARKIVEQHGGRIWFESDPGKGTTFYFTLPLHT